MSHYEVPQDPYWCLLGSSHTCLFVYLCHLSHIAYARKRMNYKHAHGQDKILLRPLSLLCSGFTLYLNYIFLFFFTSVFIARDSTLVRSAKVRRKIRNMLQYIVFGCRPARPIHNNGSGGPGAETVLHTRWKSRPPRSSRMRM